MQEDTKYVSEYLNIQCFGKRYEWGQRFGINENYFCIPKLNYDQTNIKKYIDSRVSNCRYCNLKMKKVKDIFNKEEKEPYSFGKNIVLLFCENCGWWSYFSNGGYNYIGYPEDTFGDDGIRGGLRDMLRVDGILKRFDLSSLDTPLIVIRKYVSENPKYFCDINHHKFEILVQHIYKDFFNCEVKHVGGPGDNGIDLYMVLSNEPHLIQVKCRKNPDSIESINYVRELLGTLILNNAKHGHLVTTANKFSKPAIEATKSASLEEYNIEINLTDCNKLFEMLKIANKDLNFFWERLFAGVHDIDLLITFERNNLFSGI